MPVHAIGGLFFRAQDPEALSAWYAEHLAIGPGQDGSGTRRENDWFWQTQGGPVVFMPFKAATDYWAADKGYMLNLRVSDLDGMIETLKTAGIEVITKPEWDHPDTGRFARIHDPEGNAIELWEPPGGGTDAA